MENPHPLQTILQKDFQCYPRDDGCLTVEGGDISDILNHLNRYETEETKAALAIAASKVVLIPSGAIVFPLVKFISTRTVYTEVGGIWLVEVLSNERKDLEDGRFQVVKA